MVTAMRPSSCGDVFCPSESTRPGRPSSAPSQLAWTTRQVTRTTDCLHHCPCPHDSRPSFTSSNSTLNIVVTNPSRECHHEFRPVMLDCPSASVLRTEERIAYLWLRNDDHGDFCVRSGKDRQSTPSINGIMPAHPKLPIPRQPYLRSQHPGRHPSAALAYPSSSNGHPESDRGLRNCASPKPLFSSQVLRWGFWAGSTPRGKRTIGCLVWNVDF